MKRLLSLIIVILHVLIAVGAFATQQAPAPPAAPTPTSPTGEIKNVNGSTTVEKGQTVENATAINGDVTVLGHVTGNATAVQGDVYVRAGGSIDGNATAVNGDVIKDPGGVIGGRISSVGGGGIKVSGETREGVNRVGNDVTVAKDQTVSEATAVQGDINIYGHVTGDATAVLGNVYIHPGGRVDGNAVAVLGKVVQSNGGSVGGDVTSLDLGIPSHAWWSLPGGAWWTSPYSYGGWAVYALYLGGLLVLSALLTAVVIALFPQRMTIIAECSLGKPGWSLLYGVVGAMLVLPIAILLAITCVGIPLIAVEAVYVVLLVLCGGVGVKLGLGQKIGEGTGHPIRSAVLAGVLGSCLMTLLHLVPFIGGLVVYCLLTLGAGAALMTGFGARPDWFPSRFDRTTRPTAPPMAPTV